MKVDLLSLACFGCGGLGIFRLKSVAGRSVKGKLRSRKILPLIKVHTMKYLKIAMIRSVVNFVANNRGNKIAILLLLAAILFSPNESEAMTSQ